MKKISYIVMTAVVISMMCFGCSSSDIQSSTSQAGDNTSLSSTYGSIGDATEPEEINEAEEVSIGEDYSSSDGLEFSIFKIVTSDRLQSVSGEGSYYEAESGTNYVDVILNATNSGSADFSVDDISAYFKSLDGVRYDDTIIAIETDPDRIVAYGSMAPLSTKKLHIGYKLPADVTSGSAFMQFGDELFSVAYNADVEVSSKILVSMNQKVEAEGVASFMLLETEYTADVLPPNTSRVYSHYPIDDPANDIYFVVYCDLTNNSTSDIRADKMISIKAIFDETYEYNANMVLVQKDGRGFDSYSNISPLETRKGVFMFEVPKQVQDMNVELFIYFYGNEYSCTE